MSDEMQALCFLAGANSIFYGERLLTTPNPGADHDRALLDRLGRGFGLHPLVLEDISNTDQRPKFEDYGDYIYVVLKMLHDGIPGQEIKTEQVSVIFGRDFVLSFEEAEPTVFDPVRERIRAGRARARERGADYLAYSLLDAVVDNYFSLLEQVGERMEELHGALLASPSPRMQQGLHQLRREMVPHFGPGGY